MRPGEGALDPWLQRQAHQSPQARLSRGALLRRALSLSPCPVSVRVLILRAMPAPVILSEVADKTCSGWKARMAKVGQVQGSGWRPALSLVGAWDHRGHGAHGSTRVDAASLGPPLLPFPQRVGLVWGKLPQFSEGSQKAFSCKTFMSFPCAV